MNDKISNWRWALGSLLLTAALATGIWGLTSSEVMADRRDGERSEHDRHERDDSHSSLRYNVSNASYQHECGSCHLAYPARFLPAANWKQLMGQLEDHFGENAELDAATHTAITQYLVDNAADSGDYQWRRYLDRSDSSQVSLRITEQRFFVREHDEIPPRMVTGNPQVGSFSQCDRCHQRAAQGDFDEDGVKIPGFGRWDD
ncbi:MAG TPA: diheme cytochrome c [Motiliproteus sp.]